MTVDPPVALPVSVASARLTALKVPFTQPQRCQLKVDAWNFYPSTGAIRCDGDPKLSVTGLEAFINILRAHRLCK